MNNTLTPKGRVVGNRLIQMVSVKVRGILDLKDMPDMVYPTQRIPQPMGAAVGQSIQALQDEVAGWSEGSEPHYQAAWSSVAPMIENCIAGLLSQSAKSDTLKMELGIKTDSLVLEWLDYDISGGRFQMEPVPNDTKFLRGKRTKRRREIALAGRFQWLGEGQFYSLVRKKTRFSFLEVLRPRQQPDAIGTASEDDSTHPLGLAVQLGAPDDEALFEDVIMLLSFWYHDESNDLTERERQTLRDMLDWLDSLAIEEGFASFSDVEVRHVFEVFSQNSWEEHFKKDALQKFCEEREAERTPDATAETIKARVHQLLRRIRIWLRTQFEKREDS